MLMFITALRAKALARDWDYHVWLLERTIASMLAQSQGECEVVVVCHDVPEMQYAQDARVHFLPVTFAPPARNNDDMCADKALKLSAGAKWALSRGCDYIVFNDADDLVSNRIGGFVAANYGAPGWYTADEFFYTYGGRFVRFFNIAAPYAGPCVIVRADRLEFASPPFLGKWTELIKAGGEKNYLDLLEAKRCPVSVLAAVGLQHYREYSRQSGWPLAPLPFPANIVINHWDSTSHVAGGRGSYCSEDKPRHSAWREFLSMMKQRLKKIPTLRPMVASLRQEYSIPSDREIPSRYRGGGSIFWR